MTSTTTYRLALALAVGTVLFLLLGIGALGVIGSGGPADRVYLAVPVVLVLGSILARLRPGGMAVTMLATAATQVLAPVVAFAAGLEGTEGASVLDAARGVLKQALAAEHPAMLVVDAAWAEAELDRGHPEVARRHWAGVSA